MAKSRKTYTSDFGLLTMVFCKNTKKEGSKYTIRYDQVKDIAPDKFKTFESRDLSGLDIAFEEKGEYPLMYLILSTKQARTKRQHILNCLELFLVTESIDDTLFFVSTSGQWKMIQCWEKGVLDSYYIITGIKKDDPFDVSEFTSLKSEDIEEACRVQTVNAQVSYDNDNDCFKIMFDKDDKPRGFDPARFVVDMDIQQGHL